MALSENNAEKQNSKEPQDIPESIKELVEIPAQENSAEKSKGEKPDSEKTQKEKEFSELVAKRQAILDQLKAKNQIVKEHRQAIASLISSLRGKGGGKTMRLIREAERIEFMIATEADTPKKEKELIKKLKQIRSEIVMNREADEIRKQIDSKRQSLNAVLAEIKALESDLAEARKACDNAYLQVLQERKERFEQQKRERLAQKKQERMKAVEEKSRKRRSEMEKYMRKYEDTIPMDEIVIFEKKEKKKEER